MHQFTTALRLKPGLDRTRMRDVMHECVRRAGMQDAYVEVLCTRGRPAASVDPPCAEPVR